MIFRAFIVFLSVCWFSALSAQGVYTDFGQNRIQYRQFDWQLLQSEDADIYYYGSDINLAGITRQMVREELPRMENFLAYKLGNTVQFMLFENLNHYRQSNVGYRNPQWHSGGVTTIPNDLATVYFNGDYENLRLQIRKGICEVMLREMIYGGTLQDRFDRIKSPALPVWFVQGLSEFLAEGWSAGSETRLRDAFRKPGFGNFNLMSPEELRLAGQSIWRYLVENYGTESVATVVFIARYTNSAEIGIIFHTKKDLGEFLQEWQAYYRRIFAQDETLALPKGQANVPLRIASRPNTGFALNPDGTEVAMITNDRGRFDLWLYRIAESKTIHLYSGGQKLLNQVADYGFPVVRWSGKHIWLLTLEKGAYQLLVLDRAGHRVRTITLSGFQAVTDFNIHPGGDKIVLTGINKGQADLYLCTIDGKITEQITSNPGHEHGAAWLNNGDLIWIADAGTEAGSPENIYRKEENNIRQVTSFTNRYALNDLIVYNDSIIGYLSDISGLSNAWICNLNAPGISRAQTNYKRSILSQQATGPGGTLGELLLINGHYTLYTSSLTENPESESVEIRTQSWIRQWRHMDSMFTIRNSAIKQLIRMSDDSVKLEIVDTVSRQYLFQTGYPRTEDGTSQAPALPVAGTKNASGQGINPFLPDYIVTQSDNSTLGSYLYDNTLPGKVLRNPYIMPYVKVSLSNLYKNTTVEAGARANLDLTFTDYHMKLGLNARRIDYEISGYRRSRKYDDAGNLFRQNISTAAEARAAYPFDERFRASASLGLRKEFNTIKASEKYILDIPDQISNYLTGKLELLYDNTASSGLNTMNGLRGKLSVNSLTGVNNNQNISYLHADIRSYTLLTGSITLAARLAAAYNLGTEKIAWNVGGVENWTQREQYLPNTPQLKGAEYPMQAWVCNLRGFNRAARMGSSYMVSSLELRMQLFKIIRRRPISNEFMNNLTFTAFGDAGTAFTGRTPSSPSNPFNTVYITTPNYTMSITSRRNPWLFGTGFGVRTRLLGYFIKYDYAWGLSEGRWNKPVSYISLGLDF